MIKKLIFGFMWFLIIFIVSYVGTGVIFLLFILAPETNQVKYEAARAFKDAYMIFFLAGSLFLAILGTISGILPGTKKKPCAKKKASTKKKARKKK
jgi:ABC-type Fe3+ transport system permease subunit